MDDTQFRNAVLVEHQQLHLDALAELKERMHTPGAVSTADVIKVLEKTGQSTGVLREDKAASMGSISIQFMYDGFDLKVNQPADVVDVESKEVPALEHDAPTPSAVVDDAIEERFKDLSSMLENL